MATNDRGNRGANGDETQRRNSARPSRSANIPHKRNPITLPEVRDLAIGSAMLGLDHLSLGLKGWKDFIRGSEDKVRGSKWDRLLAAFVIAGSVQAVAVSGAYVYEHATYEPTQAEQLINDTRKMEPDTGRDRFKDRRAKINEFRDQLFGVLTEEALSQFDIAMSNPRDEVELRERLTSDLDELISITEQFDQVNLDNDEVARLQILSRLTALEEKGIIGPDFRSDVHGYLSFTKVALGQVKTAIGDGSVQNSPTLAQGAQGRGF